LSEYHRGLWDYIIIGIYFYLNTLIHLAIFKRFYWRKRDFFKFTDSYEESKYKLINKN